MWLMLKSEGDATVRRTPNTSPATMHCAPCPEAAMEGADVRKIAGTLERAHASPTLRADPRGRAARRPADVPAATAAMSFAGWQHVVIRSGA